MKIFDESLITIAEKGLLQFFKDCKDLNSWYDIRVIYDCVKCNGCHKSEIKEARKRLGIKSSKQENGQCWKWGSDRSPSEVLEEKRVEWNETFKGKGH